MAERRRVTITTMGIVSPLGLGLEANRDALHSARDAIEPVRRFDVSGCRARSAGLLPALSGDERLHLASRALIAAGAELHAGDPGFIPEAAVIGTTSGGMSYGEAFFRAHQPGATPLKRSQAARWLNEYPPQKPVADLFRSRAWAASSQIIANACASGSNAIGHAFRLVREGLYQRVLCGGYDILAELVFCGFNALQASTPDHCRPFDRDRSGLVLGEGAALLALEDATSAYARGARVLAEIVGYGVSTDNFHLTQPHPSGIGPRMAMERALADAGCDADAVGYINAHGTATTHNDATEGLAIHQLFGDRVPVSSTKAQMGHSLGAAGAIEGVFTVLALQGGFLPANLHFENGDPEIPLQIVREPQRRAFSHALSNSFGFGGTNASIVFRAV